MNKQEMVTLVSEKSGFTKADSKIAYEAVIEAIFDTVIEEGKFNIAEKGTFEIRERKERNGYNPRTEETMVVPASKSIGFKCSKILKNRLV